MNVAIILAGGIGSRVGANQPKQFIDVFGKPIIIYTIEKFQNHPDIDQIEVVCVESHIEYMHKLVKKYNLNKVKWIVKGGENFQYSVINGINHLKKICKKDDIVLIHYAASPFIESDIITDAIKVCSEKGNCVSATPCYLLLGSNENNTYSKKWIDRDKVMQLNSPQCFKYSIAFDLFEEAKEKNLIDKVEPHTTTLMYLMNKTIYFSKGNQTNIKITTQEDVNLFKGYVLLQKYLNDNSKTY